MRFRPTDIILALSLRAHGALEARRPTHHLWGAALVGAVACLAIPMALFQRIRRRS